MEPTTKTHWKKVFNKDYLGSHDLDDGKDQVAEIDHVEIRVVKDSSGKDGNCNVAVFKGNVKPMILNVTNCKIIKKFACSNYIEEWGNIPVTIYSKEIRAFGEDVEALRIREKQPNVQKPELTPEHEKWNDAVAYLNKEGTTIDNIKKRYSISDANVDKLLEAAI